MHTVMVYIMFLIIICHYLIFITHATFNSPLLKHHRNTFVVADLQVDYDTPTQKSHSFHKYSPKDCKYRKSTYHQYEMHSKCTCTLTE